MENLKEIAHLMFNNNNSTQEQITESKEEELSSDLVELFEKIEILKKKDVAFFNNLKKVVTDKYNKVISQKATYNEYKERMNRNEASLNFNEVSISGPDLDI